MNQKADVSPNNKTIENIKRIFYIDNLRIFLTILVIVHHASCTFGGEGNWYLKETVQNGSISMLVLTMFNAINQSFFMGFFFLIAGYFTPASVDRKGTSSYLKDRFIRLGIPLLVFGFFIYHIIKYLIIAFNSNPVSIIEYIRISVETYSLFGHGPLWFVQTLLIFALFYLIWRRISNSTVSGITPKPLPGKKYILYAILSMGIITAIIRMWFPVGVVILSMQLAHFAQYIFLFIIGTLLYRYNWIEPISENHGMFWPVITLCSIIVMPFVFLFGGDGDPSVLYGRISLAVISLFHVGIGYGCEYLY